MMFKYNHYIPILKAKKGEFDALQSISRKTKQHLTPLINIPPRKANVAIENHLRKIAKKIGASWGFNMPVFIDIFNVDLSERMSNENHPLKYIFECLGYNSVLAIPTTGLRRDDAYNRAVAEVISKDNRGLCIRLLDDDMDNPQELNGELTNLLNSLRILQKDVHLLLDFKTLPLEEVNSAVKKSINLINNLPGILNWQSLTIAASGFPHNLKRNSDKKFIRTEFVLWKLVIASRNLVRVPSYGDYGIVHPNQPEFDGYTNSSPKIRYTVTEDWLILKGESFKTHPKGYKQYHDLSKILINKQEFLGPEFSEGDNYIVKCAALDAKSGGLTEWVRIDTTHHLTLVSEQISKTVVS